MTFLVGDKAIIIYDATGMPIVIGHSVSSVGDKSAYVPTVSGKPVLVPLSALTLGDKVYIHPTISGKNIVIKPEGVIAYPNPLNLTITGYNSLLPCTYEHSFHLMWDDVTGTYDTVWIEYSTTEFSTIPGEGTFIGNYEPTTLTINKHVLAINSWHYFTAWGVMGGFAQQLSKSKVKMEDVSTVAHLDFSRCTLDPNPTYPTNTCPSFRWTICGGHVGPFMPAKPWISPISFYFDNPTFIKDYDVEINFSNNYVAFNLTRANNIPDYHIHWGGLWGGWNEVARYVSIDVAVPDVAQGLIGEDFCFLQVNGKSVYDGSNQYVYIPNVTVDGTYYFDLGVICYDIGISWEFTSNNYGGFLGQEFNCAFAPTFSI